jgi:glycosyltransferase involved in cell wall biosynthesis
MIKESITVLLPVYNEEKTVVHMIEKLDVVLNPLFENYEMLVVESGSTDDTAKMLNELKEKFSNLRVINEGEKNGLGSGIITGLKSCESDIVLYMDSDLPFDLSILNKVFPLDNKINVLIGYRDKHPSIKRAFFSWGFNLLVKSWFNIKVKDVNFSFKVLRKNVYKGMPLISKGWFIDAEILSRANRKGFKIYEVPIVYTPRKTGASTVNISYKLISGMLQELWDYHKNEKANN